MSYIPEIKDAEVLLNYKDVFVGEKPIIINEIEKLNMHKTISIICELLQTLHIKKELFQLNLTHSSIIYQIPFEMILKSLICGIIPKNPDELATNPLFQRNNHIISLQMLLVLLKKVIVYGDYQSLENTEYEITLDDYKQIIKLQLAVVDEMDASDFDKSHFIYANYHLNYDKNITSIFARMYYMLEILSKDDSNFDNDTKNEFRPYYQDFTNKYKFSPTDLMFCVFGEFNDYFSKKESLSYRSIWKSIEHVYSNSSQTERIKKVIESLSSEIYSYKEWADSSENNYWDFSSFLNRPFIKDPNGSYLSISDYTLRNVFFEKLFWMIRECYPKSDDRAMAFFGRLFEKYIQNTTESIVAEPYYYIKEFEYDSKKSSDLYIKKSNNLLAVEVKGFSVLIDCMIKNTRIDDNNEKLFINPVLQADKFLSISIESYPDFKNIDNVFIIAVTMDSINAVPDYYNAIHEEINRKKKCNKTNYFFNLNIEEYELLLLLIEKGFDVFDLLRNYFKEEKLIPFSNYILNRFPDYKSKNNSFIERYYQESTSKMKEFIFE